MRPARVRPLVPLPAVGEPPVARRPDPGPALVVAAFALGVVVASATLLALRAGDGPTVPAAELAASRSAHEAAEAVVAAQQDRLAAQERDWTRLVALSRQMAAAVDASTASAAKMASLRASTDRAATRVQTVRVVRVPYPVPAPAATGRPTMVPAARQAAVATPDPTPPPPCPVRAAGLCVGPAQ